MPVTLELDPDDFETRVAIEFKRFQLGAIDRAELLRRCDDLMSPLVYSLDYEPWFRHRRIP